MKKRWIIIGSIILLIVLIFSLLPFFVKNYINKNGEELLGRKINIDGLYHNPLTGYTKVRNLSIFEKEDTARFVTLDELIVNIDLYKLFANTISLSELGIVNPHVYVEQQDTIFNFSDLLETSEEEPSSGDEEEGYNISLSNIYMQGGELLYYDKSLDRKWDLDDINVSIPGIYFSNQNTDVDLDLKFKDGGELISSIDYNYADNTYALGIILKNIDLSPAREYVQDYLNISEFTSILSADLKISGNVDRLYQSDLSGVMQLSDFSMTDLENQPVVSFSQLEVELDHCIPMESKINISQVGLIQPELHFTMINDSVNNFTSLMKPVEADSVTATTDESSDTLDFHIARLEMEAGKLNIRDLSPKEEFSYNFFDMKAVAQNVRPGDTTKVSFTSKAPEGGKLSIDWEGDAFYLDHQAFTLKTNIADLPSFSPYTLTLFDVPVESGHFSYTSTNVIRQNKLDGYHTILASDVEVGSKKGLEAIYSLPIKLGIYLLEDKNGDIKIEVPVTGDLNDPDYSYGKVIMKTLVGFMTKIITSPFRLFSGGGEDFDQIPIDPINPSMVPDVASRLDVLVKAIEEKPQLRVSLRQVYQEEEVAELLALYMMKEKYYLKSRNTRVSDYFSVRAIENDETEFLAYVASTTKQEEVDKKNVGELSLEFFQGDKFTQRLDTLSSSWNRVVENYLLDNNVSKENFDVQTVSPDEEHKEIGVYLMELGVLGGTIPSDTTQVLADSIKTES